MEIALLHNPRAGKQRPSPDELCGMLRRSGFQPHYFSVKEPPDKSTILRSGEFVVAAGGDGSVRSAALLLAHSGRALAPLPLGTANNIATSLGIVGSPEEIIAGWHQPIRRTLDLGVATGPWGQQCFVEGVGLGLVPHAMAIIRQISDAGEHDYKHTDDELHRDLSVWLTLANEMRPIPLEITHDDRNRRDDFLVLEILNIPRAGPRVELAANADPSDGMLDMTAVSGAEREKLGAVIESHFRDGAHAPSVVSERVKSVRVVTRECHLRVDDRLVPLKREDGASNSDSATIDISVDRAALEIILPGGAGL